MIVSFRSKALERFWWKGETRKVDPKHVGKLLLVLDTLETATTPSDMDKQGFHFHPLTGDQAGRYTVIVDRNWRVTFGWSSQGPDAIEVDYEDYH